MTEQEKAGQMEYFHQELKKIKARLVDDKIKAGDMNYDATLARVNVSQLGEEEMRIWEKYKECFRQVENNLDKEDDLVKIREKGVGSLVKEIRGRAALVDAGKVNKEVGQFYGWLNNRLVVLLYAESPAELEEEKQRVFG